MIIEKILVTHFIKRTDSWARVDRSQSDLPELDSSQPLPRRQAARKHDLQRLRLP